MGKYSFHGSFEMGIWKRVFSIIKTFISEAMFIFRSGVSGGMNKRGRSVLIIIPIEMKNIESFRFVELSF